MLVLFDNSTPRGVARALTGHTVVEARERNWDQLQNGDLLNAAEAAGFEILVTPDKNIAYQQNLKGRKIALVVLGKGRWTLVKQHLDAIVLAVNTASPGSYTLVAIPDK